MANKCRFCGRWPGFFATEHDSCRYRHERETQERQEAERAAKAAAEHLATRARDARIGHASPSVIAAMRQVMGMQISIEAAGQAVFDVMAELALDHTEQMHVLITAWETIARHVVATGQVTPEQNTLLAQLMHRFGMTQEDANRTGVLNQVVRVKLLQDLTSGRLPEYVWLDENFPVVLRKEERALWLFKHAVWFEPRFSTIWHPTQGATPGSQLFHIDKGMLLVTTKALQFVGPVRSLQIPFKKIAAVHQNADHLVISRTLATAKAVSFQLGLDDAEWGQKLVRAAVVAYD